MSSFKLSDCNLLVPLSRCAVALLRYCIILDRTGPAVGSLRTAQCVDQGIWRYGAVLIISTFLQCEAQVATVIKQLMGV